MNPKLLGSLLVGIIVLTGVYIGSLTLRQPNNENIFTNQQAQVSSSLPSGQIGYWNFDTGSGTSAVDSEGGNNLSFVGSPAWVSGRTGQALSFSGSGAALRDSSISLNSPAVTAAFWLKNDSWVSNNTEIVELSDNTNNSETGFGIYYSGAGSATGCSAEQISVSIKGNVGYNAACYAIPGAGAWHHYAFIFDKSKAATSEIKVYIDGNLQTQSKSLFSNDNTNNFSTNSLNVMTRSGEGAPTFTGILDDLRLYSKALSANEVSQLVSYSPLPIDTTAPTITGVSAGTVTTTGAVISWTTSEAADGQVEYGPTATYGSNTTLDASLGTSHSASLSGLTANTTYHYRTKSKDVAGNQAVSVDGIFTTAAPINTSVKYDVIVAKSGTGSGAVVHSGYFNCGYVCSNSILGGTQINLIATPDTNSTFTQWSSGPCAGSTNAICSFVVSANTSINAVFTKKGTAVDTTVPTIPTNLSATAASASQINLKWTASTDTVGVTGYIVYRAGLEIARVATVSYTNTGLTAATAYSYSVAAYDAAGNTSKKSASVTAATQSVVIIPTTYTLAVTKSGTGSGTVTSTGSINCGVSCSSTGDAGQSVTLTATPATGSTFSGWSGGTCSGTSATCTFTLTSNKTVTASFTGTPTTYSVTVTKAGTGSGTVTSTGSINCGTSCTANGTPGQTVTLTATPATGSTFAGWSGACTGTSTTCSFTLNSNTSANATFNLAPVNPTTFTITTAKAGTGSGTVTCNPSTCTANTGSAVSVTATPASGSTFVGWSGACTGTGACSLTSAGTVTATFNTIPPTGGTTVNVTPSTWTNLTFVRGNTYVLAPGTYSAKTFNTAADGTKVITIKSDGTGQVVFNGGIKVTQPYYVFDGVTRNSDWKSGYGMKINTNGSGKGIDLYNGGNSTAANLVFRNIEIVGNGLDNTIHDDGIYAPWQTHFVTISNVYIHDVGRTALLTGFNKNWTLEYSLIARNSSDPSIHAEGWSGTGDTNFIIRFNKFEDIEGTGFLVWLNRGAGANTNSNFEIYGNTFMYSPGNPYGRDGVGDGAIAVINEQIAQNWKIYNNSFINLNDGVGISARIAIGSDGQTGNSNIQVYNNYWWKGRNAVLSINNCSGCSVSNNRYDGVSSATGETGAQIVSNPDTASFVDYANKDFRLTSSTVSGIVLQAPYNIDMNGVTRGAGGTWDRGAYEYSGTTQPPVNASPSVTLLSSPASAVTPATFTLTASASDSDGTISKVEFYNGTTLLSTDTTSPYSASFTQSLVGSYSLTAKAYDNAGAVTTSNSVSASVTAAPIPNSTKFSTNDRVVTTDILNVRSSASQTATLLGSQPLATLGTVIGGGTSADGYYWWNINYDTGVDGWSAENYLVKYTAPTTFTITTAKAGTGSGTVTCNPSTCTANTGSAVSVTATPASGSTFVGWSGACTGTGACSLTSAGTVTATFNTIPVTGGGTAGNTCVGICYYVTPTGAGTKNGSNWANARQGLTGRAAASNWLDNTVSLAGDATYYVAGGTYPVALVLTPHSGGMTKIVKATVENSGLVTGWNSTFANQANIGAILVQGDNYSFDGVYRNENKWDDAASYGFASSWTDVDSRTGSTPGNHVSFKYFSIGAVDTGPSGVPGYPGHAFEYYKQSGTPLTDYYMGYSYLHTFNDVPIRFNNTSGAVIEYNFIGPSYTKEAIRGDAGVSNITIRHNIFLNNCLDIPLDDTANGCTAEIGPWDGGEYNNWQIYGNVFKNTISNPHSDAIIFGGISSQFDPGHKAHNWQVYNNVITGMTGGGGGVNRINIDGTNNVVRDNFWYANSPSITSVVCDTWGGSTTCTNNKVVTTNPYVNILPVIKAQVQ